MNRQPMFATIAFEAGGLILFWGLGVLGLGDYAPVAVILFVCGDAARRWHGLLGFPRIWRLFNAVALALATLDFAVAGRASARYEAIGVSLVMALVFALGALGRKSIVQEIAEQRQDAPFPEDRHDLRNFFRAYTWFWCAYFVIKAGVYLCLVQTLQMDRARALEGLIGPVSLFGMILLSFCGRALFAMARRAGLFQAAAPS